MGCGTSCCSTADAALELEPLGSASGLQRHALLVGLDYEGNPQKWPSLTGTKNDMRSLADVLTLGGFPKEKNVRLCIEAKEMTKAKFLQELDDLTAKASPEAFIFFGFSGHGKGNLPDFNHDDEADGRDEALCLFDGWLLDDLLTPKFQAIADRGATVCFYFDCCYAGGMFDGTPSRKASYFFGGKQTEKTVDSIMVVENEGKTEYRYHGQFTQWFLKAVTEAGVRLSNRQLFEKISAQRRTERQQQPVFKSGRPDEPFLL
ncbi:unnamed protein product [Effrenium voratum]|nr:unnamed protein product [Effrenium voratum]